MANMLAWSVMWRGTCDSLESLFEWPADELSMNEMYLLSSPAHQLTCFYETIVDPRIAAAVYRRRMDAAVNHSRQHDNFRSPSFGAPHSPFVTNNYCLVASSMPLHFPFLGQATQNCYSAD